MAARSQDGQKQDGPGQRRRDSAREQHEQVREARRARQHRRRVPADPEEACPREVDHAGVAELHVEPEAGDDDDEHPRDEEEREIVFSQHEGEPGDEDDGERLREALAPLPGHTRSLARSPMSPVGRAAMMAMTTAKAKTSL